MSKHPYLVEALITISAYVIVWGALFGLSVYLDEDAEYINIKKSDWECTETSTVVNELESVEECIGYRKIK